MERVKNTSKREFSPEAMAAQKKYMTFKVAVSLGALLVAIIGVVKNPGSMGDFKFIFPALVFCTFGDVFLGIADELRLRLYEPYFSLGVGSFGAAHLIFCAYYFLLAEKKITTTLLMGLFTVVLFYGLRKNGKLQCGPYKTSLYIYTLLIGTFLGFGLNLFAVEGTGANNDLLGYATCLFWVSDFTLAFRFFYDKAPKWLIYVVLTTYFGATYMIAASLFV